jgi:pimeloyl-ACP methyl ester carboxylesterase
MSGLHRVLFILGLAICLSLGWVPGSLRAQGSVPDPPGEMVDVGGYQLHIRCIGEGSPTVIMETGSGVLSLSFYPLQDQIAEFTRVCSYDRAGYGWSDSGQTPRTASQIATEFEALLGNANVETPVVLVGHSMGGMFARYFAATHPELVAGVVLVDAPPPTMLSTLEAEIPELRSLRQGEAASYERIIALVRSGRFTAREARSAVAPGLPEELVDTYIQLMAQPKALEAIFAEYVAFDYNLARTLAAGDLGGIPLIVLAARIAPLDAVWATQAWERILDFQEAQSSISTHSRFEALDSGHYIYVELPDVVLDATRELVERARAA